MEMNYKEIAYVDCAMKRKWKMLEKKWQYCTELQAIAYMKRYCKVEGENNVEFLTGDILFENDNYVIEYNDLILENVKVYEKTN